ncbi:hypothetical protein EON67_09250, partial [archaeon]
MSAMGRKRLERELANLQKEPTPMIRVRARAARGRTACCCFRVCAQSPAPPRVVPCARTRTPGRACAAHTHTHTHTHACVCACPCAVAVPTRCVCARACARMCMTRWWDGVQAAPQDDNIFIFHYAMEGPLATPFEGGMYHGVLKFPDEYPMKPPSVIMYTPNGRFQPGQRICLTISDY